MPRTPKQTRRKIRGKQRRPQRDTSPAQNPVAFDSGKLRQLYAAMLRCRMAIERARLLVKQGDLARDLGANGEEAAEVGALIDLLADDCIAPGRRELTARLILGTPLKMIFSQLYARQAGSPAEMILSRTRVAPRAVIAPAFALSGQLSFATGAAWSAKRHARPSVAVAFSGDDAVSLGFWRNAVGFCVAHKLPMVHIVHNHAGDGSIIDRLNLASQDPAASAHDPGFPAFTVDGNDVVAVYRVAHEAIRRARQGHGPALIECQTCRWCSRLETDSNVGRPGTIELDQSSDPLLRMEAYLEQKHLWSDKWKRKLMERFGKELDAAVAFAQQSAQASAGQHPSPLATAS